MRLYFFNPLGDPRWARFVEEHPRSSVFHTAPWLDALHRTCGYEPIALTTSAPGENLETAVVFCRVSSWLTGRRLVSLPFSDHCEPLVKDADELNRMLAFLARDVDSRRWSYFEVRPVDRCWGIGVREENVQRYVWHTLNLRQDADAIFRGFHKDCVQRKIRRAEREALEQEEGRSEALLAKFYRLLVLTRVRHHLPPQPLDWFRNLITCMGDILSIRVASKNGRPVAGILTLRFKDTVVFKYGCSDTRFNKLGGTQLLLWNAIQDARSSGLTTFDMGRSDVDNLGLITFKNRWGATRSELAYFRYPARGVRHHFGPGVRFAQQLLAFAPEYVVTAAGSLLYRHLG